MRPTEALIWFMEGRMLKSILKAGEFY